jgi:hypothetical protein
MTLLAAFQALLSRYCGQLDVTVGVPASGRWHPALEDVVGCFANMLAVLDVLGGTWTVPEGQPESFGIRGESVPKGFVGQMVAPFVNVVRRRAESVVPASPVVVRTQPAP